MSCRRHYPLYTNTYTGCSYILKNIVSSPLYFLLESSFTRFPAYSATLAVRFSVSHSPQESPGASIRRALTHDNLQSIRLGTRWFTKHQDLVLDSLRSWRCNTRYQAPITAHGMRNNLTVLCYHRTAHLSSQRTSSTRSFRRPVLGQPIDLV